MKQYMLFWLAKELIPLAFFVAIFALFACVYGIAVLNDKLHKRKKK